MRKLMILLSLMLISCMKTDIIGEVEVRIDTVATRKPHRPPHPPFPPRDTTDVNDTSRVSMGWNPTVEDWDGTDVDM